jgi:hypothetical protein
LSIWEALGTVYVIGIFLTWVFALLYIESTDHRQKVLGARLVFLALVWFVPVAIVVYRWFRWLWRLANWKMKL